MLSTDTRIRLEDICARIKSGLNVTLEEMTFTQKWADHNRVAARMLNQARRVSAQGEPEPGSLDELLNGLDLGNPDPAAHLIGPQNPVDLAEWFMRDQDDEWRRHD
jgi:hypothetical protein